MHISPVVALLAATLSLPAFAQQSILVPDTSSVQIQGPQGRYKLNPSQFQDYMGRYLLSNGKSMRLSHDSKRLFMQVEDEPRVEIVPLASNEFVARGTGVRLQFAELYGNRTSNLTMTESAPDSSTRLGAR